MALIEKPDPGAPCPCGSGRASRDCHLAGINLGTPPESPPADILRVFHEQEQRTARHTALYGHVRPIRGVDYQGRKFVIIGSKLFYSSEVKTVPDALLAYLLSTFGMDWAKSEAEKPLAERHPIMQFHAELVRLRSTVDRDPDGLARLNVTGGVAALLLLAYDVFILDDELSLQRRLVERLKHPDQFQGARHELFAFATCVRAGFKIELSDEEDVTTQHMECDAIHMRTGHRITVEAKSKHRHGVLGYNGGAASPSGGEPEVAVHQLLVDAFKKPATHPVVLFVDLNIPAQPLDPSPPLIPGVSESLTRALRIVKCRPGLDPEPFNLLVATNHPFHYNMRDIISGKGQFVFTESTNPKIPIADRAVVRDLLEALPKFGSIPTDFE